MSYLNIDGREIRVSNLDKVFWPKVSATKGQMIEFYIKVSPLMLPHLKNRMMSLQRFPGGAESQGFYQKNCPADAPPWIKTHTLVRQKGKITNYILVQDLPTLTWLANSGVIEFHPWLSSVDSPDNPDFAVFDLDPMERFGLGEVTQVAAAIGRLLGQIKLKCGVKTSGATGLQIFVPLEPIYTYKLVRDFVQLCCSLVYKQFPHWTTMERSVKERQGKIYLDYMQNAREKTIAAAYSLRPHPNATYSAPLAWEQVYSGDVDADAYNLHNLLNGQIPLPWLEGIPAQRLDSAMESLRAEG